MRLPVKFQRMHNLLVIQNIPYMRCKLQLFHMEQCSEVILFVNVYTIYFNTFFWNLLSPHMKQTKHFIPLHRPTCFLILIAWTMCRKMNSVWECRHLNEGLKQINVCYFHNNRGHDKSCILNNWTIVNIVKSSVGYIAGSFYVTLI